tara:strand:- start:629 stop:856 length:228 start_codon:yes stop_codon:yes gene_type:complete
MQWGGIMKTKLKKYVVTAFPIMESKAYVKATDEQEAWDIYMGNKKGNIEYNTMGMEYSNFSDYLDPELEEVKEEK